MGSGPPPTRKASLYERLFLLVCVKGQEPTRSRFDKEAPADGSMPVSFADSRRSGEASPTAPTIKIKKHLHGVFFILNNVM